MTKLIEQQILDNAPEKSWTHAKYPTGSYFKKDGLRFMVWIKHTQVWSVPICNVEDLFMIEEIRSREQIEQIIALQNESAEKGKRIAELESLCRECADYLDTNELTNIGHKSVFHKQLRSRGAE